MARAVCSDISSQAWELNNRAENSHQPTRVREKVMRRFKSARHLQRFASVHDQVGNLFMYCRYNTNAQQKREARDQAFEAWGRVTCVPMPGPPRRVSSASSCAAFSFGRTSTS